ncbi:MAG: hypothetical protein WBA28_04830 [Microbacteriaceae bacterium]
MDEEIFHPSTGTLELKGLAELPKRTVGKRLGITAFVLAWIPLAWFGLVLMLSFVQNNVPANTGIGYVVTPLWYLGLIVVPLLGLLALVVAFIGVFRPSVMGKVWSLIAMFLSLLTALSFIFGYFTIKP